jgi:CHAT domain-containing protein
VALLGPDATESKFKSQPLGNFRVLHFAVHGLSDPQFPDRAALVLGRDPNSSDDGPLPPSFPRRRRSICRHSREGGNPFQQITQLSLSADLVTLSACDTAKGKLEGEEGIDGLAEAFLLAGTKSVVGALWEVDDSATRSLMKAFYTHLAQGQDKTSALQQAKLDYLRTSANSSPALWAPFTLIGDGSAPIIF